MTYKWMELTHGEAWEGDRIMGMTSTFTGISCSSKCLAPVWSIPRGSLSPDVPFLLVMGLCCSYIALTRLPQLCTTVSVTRHKSSTFEGKRKTQ